MNKNLTYALITFGLMAGGATALGSPSINAIGLLTNYIPPAGSGLGGYADCTQSGINAVSPDGQIGVGYVHGDIYWDGALYEAGQDIPVYWSKTTGLVPRFDDWRHGQWTGIGLGTGTPGPNYTASIAGTISGIGRYSAPTINQDYPDPYSTTTPLEPVSACMLAPQNSVSGNNRFFAGDYSDRKGAYIDHAIRWDANSSYAPTYVLGIGTTVFTGVANDGACVGTDRHGSPFTTKGAIYWTESGGVQDVPPLAGNATTSGEGRGISDNNAYVTGLMHTDSGTPMYQAFRWSPGETSSTPLPPMEGDLSSWATDLADDGTAVGWTYNDIDSYRACVWDTAGQPHLLRDLLVAAGVDTSSWTKLTKAYSITPDAKYIAGYGATAGGIEEGFVAEIAPIPIAKPSLNILLAGANVIITWPTNATGYALQHNTNLTTTAWTPVPDTPTADGTNWAVTVPAVGAQEFYRLQK